MAQIITLTPSFFAFTANSGVKTVVNTPQGQQILVRQPGSAAGQGAKTVIQKILQPGTPNILQKTPQTKLIAAKTSTDGTSSTPGQARVVTTSLQQLLAQNPGQKIVLNQGTPNQRILIAANSPATPATGQQQQILVQQPGGQVVQQIITSSAASGSGGQQQIVVGNQRILLNTGQRIIAGTPVQGTPVKAIIHQQPVQVATSTPQQIQYQIQTSPVQPPPQQNALSQSNGSIAQQLASGKLRMVTYNGQQVIIKPLSNNSAMLVAHVKQQENGPAQIVVNNTAAADTGGGGGGEGVATEQEATPGPSVEQRVSKTITAQLVQSAEGPKFVLQGLGTNELTPQQLTEIKQHVMKGEWRV